MEVECSNSRPPGSDSLTGEEEVNVVTNMMFINSNIMMLITGNITSLPFQRECYQHHGHQLNLCHHCDEYITNIIVTIVIYVKIK